MTGHHSNSGAGRSGGWRFAFLYVLPTLLLLVVTFLPIIAGGQTLFYRDVTNVHMPMRSFQAQAMLDGYLPIVNEYIGGGQPHLGNPNTVALYPDNLLYLTADPRWALNAHFWIHVLLAPFMLFWLARVWGLSREAAWVGGVVFGLSGYFLSSLNLYNVIATIVWAPALVASALRLAAPERRAKWLWATAAVWALLIVSGDPITAVLALLLAFTAVAVKHEPRTAGWGGLLVAIGLGTMLAAPMVIEFLRVLPLTFRGHWGYSEGAAMVGSWNPWRVIEWFLPLAFGRPDIDFWGTRLHSDNMPLFHSLSPGIIAMSLALAGYRSRQKLKWWASLSVVAGLFFALGGMNPIVGMMLRLPGAGLLRLPVKFWLLVAIGGSMLAALGAERLVSRGESGAVTRAMGLLAGLVGTLWLVLVLASGRVESWIAGWLPDGFSPAVASAERLRWTGLALLAFLLVAGSLLIVRLGRARLAWVMPALLLFHVGSQLFFLRPLFEFDDISAYREPSPVTAIVPKGGRVVHGTAAGLFEARKVNVGSFPTASFRWPQRAMFRKLFPFAGIMGDRRYEFFLTPEGLSSFLTRATAQALEMMDDSQKVRVMAASGVEWLLVEQELDAALLEAGDVELAGSVETGEGPIHVYRLLRAAPEAQFVGTLHSSDNMNEAVDAVLESTFDPLSEAVLAGTVMAGSGETGAVVTRLSEGEKMEWDVEAPGSGALLVQRSHLPLYRATVDGQPAAVHVANISRMAILLEPGNHTVKLWVDRRPFRLGIALSIAALAMLLALPRSERSARWLGLIQETGDQ